jgi:conjugal transfer ATP-binding protein TraC
VSICSRSALRILSATGLEDAERLRNALQRGDERVFSVSLYVLLRAPTKRALDDATRRVETQLDGLLTHSRVALFEQERAFRSCLPEGRDRLLVPRNLDTSSLAISLPMASSSLVMEHGVLYGVAAQSQSPIIIDPFDSSFLNYNLAVIAPSGSGKSYFTKLLALRHLVAGTEFLVIDPEDENRAVAEAVGGTVVRLAASSPHRLNPLDLVPVDSGSADAETDPLAQSIAVVLGRLELLLCAGGGPSGAPGVLDIYERAVLDQALMETYAAAGITSDPTTHERQAPLLAHLHAVLTQMDSEARDTCATPYPGSGLTRRGHIRGSHEHDTGPALHGLPHPRVSEGVVAAGDSFNQRPRMEHRPSNPTTAPAGRRRGRNASGTSIRRRFPG